MKKDKAKNIEEVKKKMAAEKAAVEEPKSYYVKLSSKMLPFTAEGRGFEKMEDAERVMQDFVKYVEKKFDAVWYIGTDYFGEAIYERFMFHHGGFMEISLKGEIKCFFGEDKCDKMKSAIFYALEKLCSRSKAKFLAGDMRSGHRLINLGGSLD
jgi:hypothetical protein